MTDIDALIEDADDRGLFNGIDDDIREEIEAAWKVIFADALSTLQARLAATEEIHEDTLKHCAHMRELLAAAEARVKALTKAGKPFVECLAEYDITDEDSQCLWGASFLTVGDLRRFEATLNPAKEDAQ